MAVYLNFTQLFYIDDLLEAVKREFCSLYKEEIKQYKTVSFDERFDKILDKYEQRHLQEKKDKDKKPREFQVRQFDVSVNSDGSTRRKTNNGIPQTACYVCSCLSENRITSEKNTEDGMDAFCLQLLQ